MKAIVVTQTGGPEQLRIQEVSQPPAGPGQALVKVEAAGVNYIEVYQRTGLYKLDPPFTPGGEGAGTVEAVGEGVADLKPGDRVAWGTGGRGSYAQFASISASQLVKIPEGVDGRKAAAVMLQGMTAHYLTHSTFALKRGDTCLVHAAAGGVGLLMVQMAKMLGARVIGTTSTPVKADHARAAGADEIILYTEQDFEAEVKRLTGGRGVDVVYDSVGQTTFMKSISTLRPRGMMVSFGNSSGPVPAIQPLLLGQHGSLFLTRPSLMAYTATREELLWRASDVLGWIASGKLKIRIERDYPLEQAAHAHRDIESRSTSGKLLLIP